VALDGTKVAANASVHKAMSYGRMQTEKRLAAEVSDWLTQAEATDAEEDRTHGGDRRGDEMPDWVANKAARLERIRAAKATLEAEAKQPPPDNEDGPGPSSGMMKSGKPQRGPDGGPPDRAQRNCTDPDSRIQPLRSKAVIAGYNAQIAVDGAHQIIVAQRLQTSPADARALPGLLADIRAVLHANPQEVSADAGYCDEHNLRHLARRRIDSYLAPGRARHSQKHAAGSRQWPKRSRKAAMATKLKRAGRRSRYRLRDSEGPIDEERDPRSGNRHPHGAGIDGNAHGGGHHPIVLRQGWQNSLSSEQIDHAQKRCQANHYGAKQLASRFAVSSRQLRIKHL
jgi:Transposase DDE domain